MIAHVIELDGEELVLLLAEPDWADQLPETYEQLDTEIEETRAGVEHRRPGMAVPLLGIVYSALLVDADWQEWRGLQAFVGDRRVACPIWPDAVPVGQWDTVVHSGTDYVVGWSGDFDLPTITRRADGLPERDFVAPLVVGKLRLNEDVPLCGNVASIAVQVDDDRARGIVLPEVVYPVPLITLERVVRLAVDVSWQAYDAEDADEVAMQVWGNLDGGEWALIAMVSPAAGTWRHLIAGPGVLGYRVRMAFSNGEYSPYSAMAYLEITPADYYSSTVLSLGASVAGSYQLPVASIDKQALAVAASVGGSVQTPVAAIDKQAVSIGATIGGSYA